MTPAQQIRLKALVMRLRKLAKNAESIDKFFAMNMRMRDVKEELEEISKQLEKILKKKEKT